MDIRRRIYPYPVLAYYKPNEDYQTGKYSVNIAVGLDGYQTKLTFDAELTEPGLASLVNTGSAKYAYHLEGVNTCYRKVVLTDEKHKVVKLSNKEVRGRLQICPFVVAVKDIPGYTNTNFHPDYDGMIFDIDAGSILAVAEQARADIDVETDDFRNLRSIFSVLPNPDENTSEMVIELQQTKIVSYVSREDKMRFDAIKGTMAYNPVIDALVAIPALTHAIDYIKNASPEALASLSEMIWFKSVKKRLKKVLDCDIDNGGLNGEDPLIVAQKLLNEPFTEALKVLVTAGSPVDAKGGDSE